MLDITLCGGGECPLKYACFRFTAEAYGRQDYFGSVPFKAGNCEHFMDNTAQIRQIAYYLWLEAGKPEGEHEKHWLKAQEAIRLT